MLAVTARLNVVTQFAKAIYSIILGMPSGLR